jgi:hypothetical protein
VTSKFIEGSKHAEFTAAVEKHFSGGNVGQRPGQDPMLKASPGGSPAWNASPGAPIEPSALEPRDMDEEPVPPGPSMFNASSPPRPREGGVNYQPHSHVGNRVTDDPFEGLADGMPGSARKFPR